MSVDNNRPVSITHEGAMQKTHSRRWFKITRGCYCTELHHTPHGSYLKFSRVRMRERNAVQCQCRNRGLKLTAYGTFSPGLTSWCLTYCTAWVTLPMQRASNYNEMDLRFCRRTKSKCLWARESCYDLRYRGLECITGEQHSGGPQFPHGVP